LSILAHDEMNNPWDCIKSGKYEEAVAAYSAATDQSATGPTYRNRATAFLLLQRYDDAFRDIEAAEAMDPIQKEGHFHSDNGQVRLGVVEWLAGKPFAAAERWLRIGSALDRGEVAYSDASGGLVTASILRFAAARLVRADIRRVADRLIKKLVKKPAYHSWPLPIGSLYADVIGPQELLESVSRTPILRERELC
jgi:tetratricopeptide (TPR) repeat protein